MTECADCHHWDVVNGCELFDDPDDCTDWDPVWMNSDDGLKLDGIKDSLIVPTEATMCIWHALNASGGRCGVH